MLPECSRCNATNVPAEELAFLKTGNSSWELVCQKCIKEAGMVWNKPGELRWLGSYAGLYDPDTYRLLSSIKEQNGQKPDKISENERRYERHKIVLRGFIKRNDEDPEILAVIEDLSKGGLRFVSKTEFAIAETAKIRIEQKKDDAESSDIHEIIEIVRVIPQRNGTFEMGARFLSAETAGLDKKSRAKKDRHDILLKLRYKLSNTTPGVTGAVLELGRKTALLLLTDQLENGKKFAVMISGESGVFARQELSGIAVVKRSEMIYSGNYEVLVELQKIKINKR